jgi:hypothetical protein
MRSRGVFCAVAWTNRRDTRRRIPRHGESGLNRPTLTIAEAIGGDSQSERKTSIALSGASDDEYDNAVAQLRDWRQCWRRTRTAAVVTADPLGCSTATCRTLSVGCAVMPRRPWKTGIRTGRKAERAAGNKLSNAS